MNFLNALQTNDRFTENGMLTHSTSGNSVLDMFFKLGGARKSSNEEILQLFTSAFAFNRTYAVRCLFYNRNIRGGQGERRTFRICFEWLCKHYPWIAQELLPFVPEFGRWDDVLVGLGTPIEKQVSGFVAEALFKGDKLCAKWMPRENKSQSKSALRLIDLLGLTRKGYRQLLAGNTQVVENLMCERRWKEINYSHVPSKAIARYDEAFAKHDQSGFENFLLNLPIKAKAIFPVDVLLPMLTAKTLSFTRRTRITKQWGALPNFVPAGKRILPVVDVSSSMEGSNENPRPIDVSIALGLYLAERNDGPFKNHFITFSERPTLLAVHAKDLFGRVQEVKNASWGGNTNLEAVFKLILNSAVASKISKNEMPSDILVISDMQFDPSSQHFNANVVTMIQQMYTQAGYEMPQLIFWNVRSSNGVPAKANERGVVLVSGYSPSVVKSIFDIDLPETVDGVKPNPNPMELMLSILDNEPYTKIIVQ